ncbi:hypothetical protein GIV23_07785 [Pseudomonas sp. PA-1-2A]|nr:MULTISPECIES: hypothetical protein [Pseudomonas]MCF5691585.1 hypothetical protein [Pseudomonas sp. PA-1-8C]MCF5786794.1 hypothetical protein [Pseudomonas sp. PA-1-6G]MCF5792682.1 hypothetical protein [Pseudomonas sp. PA-1-6B]MCF5813214.1 hypothetical protein [Pseudomonas sp. PA-1-2A]MCF5833891.1 hypothetical protein [Pseudomonas sp. PA-1-6A]
MEKNLTIIKGALALVNYPFTTLPEDVLDLMHRSYAPIAREGMGQLTKLFDAYCDITKTTVTYVGMSSPAFGRTVRGFLGALSDETFVEISSDLRKSYAREFVRLIHEMAKVVPLLPTFEGKEGWPKTNAKYWTTAKDKLDPQAVRFWNGWPVESLNGKTSYISFANLWISHGPEFTEKAYKALSQWTIKMRRPRCSEFSSFLNFVSERAEAWPAEAFQDPIQIKHLFLNFMVWYFNDQLAQNNDLAASTKSYAAFINVVNSAMLSGGTWAKPFVGTLPKPPITNVAGEDTNNKKNSKGEVFKEKLITQIPYQLSDTQAIELLFKEIKADNDALYKWASAKAWKVSNNQKARNRLAKSGSSEKITYPTHFQPEELNPDDVCAAFNQHGFDYVRRDFSKRFGKNINREFLNSFLHVPTPDDLYPYKLLLVHGYPCITQSFIDNLELYNEKGDLHGFLKLEGYYQLTGYKDRKGGKHSEIKIKLKPRDAVRVRQVIRATQPLRDYLREQGDDAWRYLFIACSRGLTYPTKMMPTNWSAGTLATRYQHLADEFSPFLNLSKEDVEEFICRISITSLRATRAVLIYIQSNSITETAKALGHTDVSLDLLSRYLPPPILAFFQTRWIRAFQRGIICMAMKDSKYLLKVSNFQTMDELHTFLDNNALKDIPQSMRDPESIKNPKPARSSPEDKEAADRVVISLDVGILTTLLSIEEAVRLSPRPDEISAKALYWAKLTNLLVNDITDGNEFDLQDYLETARAQIDSAQMENLIYATAA